MNAQIWQGAAAAELEPPIVQLERRVAFLVGEHEGASLPARDSLQDLHRLTAQPDRLGAGLAIRQQQARRLYPVPLQPTDLLRSRTG